MLADFRTALLARASREKLRHKERQRQIREFLVATYETTPGDLRFCVRRREVVAQTAVHLGIAVVNNEVFAEVEAVARSIGFQPIKNGNRALFRCVRRRGVGDEMALALSRANRFDTRCAPKLAVVARS